jgi:hypothetical protein
VLALELNPGHTSEETLQARAAQAQKLERAPEPERPVAAAGRLRFPAGSSHFQTGRPRQSPFWSAPTLGLQPCSLRTPHRTGAASFPRRRPAPGRKSAEAQRMEAKAGQQRR